MNDYALFWAPNAERKADTISYVLNAISIKNKNGGKDKYIFNEGDIGSQMPWLVGQIVSGQFLYLVGHPVNADRRKEIWITKIDLQAILPETQSPPEQNELR